MDAITDRTKKDVEDFKELRKRMLEGEDITAKYLTACERACFLHTTANRIEKNTEYVKNIIADIGYHVQNMTTKQNWNMKSFDNINPMQELERMRANVQKLIDFFTTKLVDMPKDMKLSDDYYKKINALEGGVIEIEALKERIEKSYRYAGQLHAGE